MSEIQPEHKIFSENKRGFPQTWQSSGKNKNKKFLRRVIILGNFPRQINKIYSNKLQCYLSNCKAKNFATYFPIISNSIFTTVPILKVWKLVTS